MVTSMPSGGRRCTLQCVAKAYKSVAGAGAVTVGVIDRDVGDRVRPVSDSLISSTFDSRNGEALGQIDLRNVAASEHLFEICHAAPQHLGEGLAIGRPSAIGR